MPIAIICHDKTSDQRVPVNQSVNEAQEDRILCAQRRASSEESTQIPGRMCLMDVTDEQRSGIRTKATDRESPMAHRSRPRVRRPHKEWFSVTIRTLVRPESTKGTSDTGNPLNSNPSLIEISYWRYERLHER